MTEAVRITYLQFLPRAHAQGVKRYLLSVVCFLSAKNFQISYKKILLQLIIVS